MSGFSGIVLYFTPKGKYVSSSAYKNGHLVTAAASQQIQNVSKTKVNEVQECINWYWCYLVNGEVVNTIYLYSDCSGFTNNPNAPGDGGGSAGPPAPPQCPGTNALRPIAVNQVDPNDGGGDGGFTPPDSGQCPLATKRPLLDKLLKTPSTLTEAQKDQIEAILQQLSLNCIGRSILDYMGNGSRTFDFNVSSTMNVDASYNPSNGSIKIRDPYNLTVAGIQEELFHAYQNFLIPGGTSQYADIRNADGTILTHTKGAANIEFEIKVLNDMNSAIKGSGFIQIEPNYGTWIYDITNNGTSLPTSFNTTDLDKYKTFLADAVNPSFGTFYANEVPDYNLLPTSMFSLISSSPCITH